MNTQQVVRPEIRVFRNTKSDDAVRHEYIAAAQACGFTVEYDVAWEYEGDIPLLRWVVNVGSKGG